MQFCTTTRQRSRIAWPTPIGSSNLDVKTSAAIPGGSLLKDQGHQLLGQDVVGARRGLDRLAWLLSPAGGLWGRSAFREGEKTLRGLDLDQCGGIA